MALIATLEFWQKPLWQRLCQALESGRLAHGLLLSGVPGLGKRELATAFAQRLLCQQAKAMELACGQCKSCQLNLAGHHPDLAWVMPEEGKKQISVNQVRELRERLAQTAQQGRFRVAVVTPADAMNVNAANALLKTLEEPGSDTVILLVTARPQAVPITVRSRCQQLVLATPAPALARVWLGERHPVSSDLDEALAAASGAPLAAEDLLSSGELALRHRVADTLTGLASGREEPVSAAAGFPAEQLLPVLTAAQGVVAQAVKAAAMGAGFEPGLFRILDRITEARRLVLNNANINAQLSLEAVFVAWFELHAKLRHSK